jgi:hypothetical protein
MKLLELFRRSASLRSSVLQSTAVEVTTLASANVRLITSSLREAGLRELELTEVPADLREIAIDLLGRLEARARTERPQRDGDGLAGQLVIDTFPALHIATLRIVSRTTEPGAEELFRVVDFGESSTQRFPLRLVATHLAALAAIEPQTRTRVALARRSVELFAGEPAKDDGRFEFDRGENLNNYAGWDALGDALIDAGEVNEGIDALGKAAERCPAWASDFAAHVRATAGTASSSDPRIRFWLSR